MEAYAPLPPGDPFAASETLFTALAADLAGPGAAGLTACELEELLDARGREVLRQLLQDHYDLRAAREDSRPAPAAGTARRPRAPTGSPGPGWKAGAPAAGHAVRHGPRHPLRLAAPRGAELAPGRRRPVPAGRAALPLAGHAGRAGGRPRVFRRRARRDRPPLRPGDRQAAGGGVRGDAAADVPAFYAARPPEPCTPATLLIMSADCKGIVMRPAALRAATARAAAKAGRCDPAGRRGEPNRKRMATLVTVYDAGPAARRPHDVIAPPGGRHGTRQPRRGPKARGKWLAGSVRCDAAAMIAAMFDEAAARDPQHLRTWVVLVDGAEHSWTSSAPRPPARRHLHVITDIIHVLEYIWGAAWSLHGAGDPAAEDWVAAKALAVLAGDSERVAAQVSGEADAAGLAGTRRNRRRRLRPLPRRPHRLPPLRQGPRQRLAHRDRGHRRRLPAPHRRPPRHRRSQMGPRRRRSRPDPPRRHRQRRLPRILALPPRPRAPAAPPRHRARTIHTRSLTNDLTPKQLRRVYLCRPCASLDGHPEFQVPRTGPGRPRRLHRVLQ